MKTIENYAFRYCYDLKCIYFYGETSPKFGTDVFANISTNSVMTHETYKNDTFSTLNVVKGSTIDECLSQNDTSKTLIIFTTVCVSVAADVVATLLITLLVKIRRN